jgi:hypothetical protein
MRPAFLRLLIPGLAVFLWTACEDDLKGLTLTFVIDTPQLTNGGANSSTRITVSLQDGNRNPPSQGTRVALTCVDQTGTPAGRLGGATDGSAVALSDQSGFAIFQFACSGAPTDDLQIFCIATVDGERERSPILTCAPAG